MEIIAWQFSCTQDGCSHAPDARDLSCCDRRRRVPRSPSFFCLLCHKTRCVSLSLSLSLSLKNMHTHSLSVSVSSVCEYHIHTSPSSPACEYHIHTSPSSPAFESILHISSCTEMHARDVHRMHPCASGEVYPLDEALDVCPSVCFLKSSFCREIQFCLNAPRHQCCCCCQEFVIVVQTIQCVLKLYRDPVLAECSSKTIIMLLSLKLCCCSKLWVVA